MKIFEFILFIFLLTSPLYSQLSTSYSLEAKLKIENKLIEINQKLIISNNQKKNNRYSVF